MALTKVPIELSSTPSISDSGDATAITIDSSERVGIGSTSPVAPLTINDKATFSFNSSDFALGHQLYYDGGDDRWERLTGNAGSAVYQTAGNILFYRTAAGGSTGDAVTPSESARITSGGQLAVGTTGYGTGVIAYDRDVGAPNYGLNITENTTFNDNSGHTFTSKQNTHGYIYIKVETAGNGMTTIPFFPNAGGGVGFAWNALDPDAGTFQTSGTITFTMAGSAGLAFTVSFATGSGQLTITRTAGSSLYRVVFMELAQV